jgi:hypothetical protein
MALSWLFIPDRKNLKNVSPATLVFYQNCLRGLQILPDGAIFLQNAFDAALITCLAFLLVHAQTRRAGDNKGKDHV